MLDVNKNVVTNSIFTFCFMNQTNAFLGSLSSGGRIMDRLGTKDKDSYPLSEVSVSSSMYLCSKFYNF